jgi:hypothetical protein
MRLLLAKLLDDVADKKLPLLQGKQDAWILAAVVHGQHP